MKWWAANQVDEISSFGTNNIVHSQENANQLNIVSYKSVEV